MRAAVFQGPGKPLSIETLADPTPGPLEVVVKVGRCGICGTDLHITETEAGPLGLKPGQVPGHEFAGEVVALGAEVAGLGKGLEVGRQVAVMPFVACGRCRACLAGEPSRCAQARSNGLGGVNGGYADYALAGALACVPLPEPVGLAEGALVEPMAVSLHGVRGAEIRPGDRVLVIGAGPIGLAACYWARRAGARVVATAASRRREDLARTLGADGFVVEEAGGPPLGKLAAQALGGRPDVVFECVGTPGMIARSIDAVRYGGLVVVLGFCVQADTFMPAAAMAKEARLRFAALYDRREFEICVDAFEAGAAEPAAMITDVVSLDETPAAFEALRHRTHQCKVQIAPNA
jgi:(R,R)-butanediol dehydrogenase/meso-butanediol dehydrogenase/diacetyl reductase